MMTDSDIIDFYGGSKALCKKLGWSGVSQEIKVYQWKTEVFQQRSSFNTLNYS
jgi:hypothetical protein